MDLDTFGLFGRISFKLILKPLALMVLKSPLRSHELAEEFSLIKDRFSEEDL